ncbi:T9SS type A sorting domain-containing protein [Winogradskyella schleiferi]|uniref:T9SS type A sorting domain-containing protein n=1 Tax=Winogradskyella schleiferi TaxID=2686078 RepID=UPI0015BC8DDC|nr:T9SS type A sorting domain-containing protein [Winogradskyella schleiferi]
MKQFLFFSIFFSFQFSFSQIEFQEHIVSDITYGFYSDHSVFNVDIDNDGDLDILYSAAHKIGWYENIGGLGNFAPQKFILVNTNIVYSPVHAADLDGDGDMDVIGSIVYDDKIVWFENIDGLGNFSEEQVILNIPYGSSSLFAADIDGDNDMDIVTASEALDKVSWFENTDGLGSFGVEQIITTNVDLPRSVYVTDIDGDGDLDVLSSSVFDDKIAWYENTDGLGTFGVQQVIINVAYGASSVFSSDIDGDGDMDVLSSSRSDNKIAWYENTDGLGNFGNQQLISNMAMFALNVLSADLDGDGDMDVLSASYDDNKIAWYENLDGLGSFGSQQVMTTSATRAKFVQAGDFDNDGDLDAVSAFRSGLFYHENSDGLGSFEQERLITRGQAICKPYVIYADDMDGDGNMDILSSSYFLDNQICEEKLVWYKNSDGLGSFGFYEEISNNFKAQEIYTADLDGDGDKDVLTSNWDENDNPIWYENLDGLGNFTDQEIDINTIAYGIGIQAEDMDNDGDLDIIMSNRNSMAESGLFWHENIDGLASFGAPQMIMQVPGFSPPHSFDISDIDGDGDKDIFVMNGTFNLSWIENLNGQGLFGEPQLIDATDNIANIFLQSLHAVDLDNDGNIDIVCSSPMEDKIVWYKNLDEQGQFGSQQILTNDAAFVNTVYTADVDNDGDLDVLSASYYDDKIAYYKNMGLGVFSSQQVISVTADGATSVYVADINNDGKIDVLSSSSEDSKIAWYGNISTLSVSSHALNSIKLFPNPTKNQLNITSKTIINRLTIFDINGRLLSEIELSNSEYTLDVSTLTKGVYFLEIKSGESKSTKKFIKH